MNMNRCLGLKIDWNDGKEIKDKISQGRKAIKAYGGTRYSFKRIYHLVNIVIRSTALYGAGTWKWTEADWKLIKLMHYDYLILLSI